MKGKPVAPQVARKVDVLAGLLARVGDLEMRVALVDRQSRCRHVWEPDRKDPAKRVCAECGCSPLKG